MFFWVSPRLGSARLIKWALLKKRLVSACPSSRAQSLLLPDLNPQPDQKVKEIYLLQACSGDRAGLLNDLAHTLWELDLDITMANSTTAPDGRAINLLYFTDHRDTLQNRTRRENVCDRFRDILGNSCFFCELHPVSPECISFDGETASSVPSTVPEDLFIESVLELDSGDSGIDAPKLSVNLDNSWSPRHTVLKIAFRERKGLLYDCTRTLKDLGIRVAYARLSTSEGGGYIELFILRENGSTLCDPLEQKTLLDLLELNMRDPVRVMVVDRGSETELLVATTVESSGKGRPRVLYDVTLVLKMLEICIFKADLGRLRHGDRQWEVYRFLLAEKPGSLPLSRRVRNQIAERVKNVLAD